MKRIFTSSLFILFLIPQLQSQTCTAVPVITLNPAGASPIGAFMMVTYNPLKNLYYWNSGGYGSNPVVTYNSLGGNNVAIALGNQDWRGLWWNSNTNVLEGNCFNSVGIFTVTTDPVNGYALPGSNIVAVNQQPNSQSGGQYDPVNNQVLYYTGSLSIAKYSRATGTLVSTVSINGLPPGYGSLSLNGFYTGIPGQEYAVFDYTNRRAYYINYNTGAYVSTVQFPPSAGAPANFGISYANGLFFIYDNTNWVGYRAGVWAWHNGPICTGQSATIAAQGATSYSWSSGALTSSIVVSPTTSTNFTVVATPTAGCLSSFSLNLNVYPDLPPSVSVAGSTLICGSGTNVLTASGASTYTWTGGPANASFAVSPTSTAVYTVTGTNSVGCNASANSTITVSIPSISLSGSLNLCTGESTTLTASGMNTYSWSTGSNSASIVLTPTATEIFTVSATNSLGCTAQLTPTINLYPNPMVSIAGSTAVCNGQSLALTGNGASTYSWNTGAITLSIALNPTVSGSYSVVGTSSAGCTGTSNINITVNPSPSLSVIGGTTSTCPNTAVSLTVTGANTYSWSTGSFSASIAVAPVITTIYTVVGTFTNTGCYSQMTKTLVVNPSPTLSVTDATICAGETATLTVFGAANYTWSNGSNLNTIMVSPSTHSVYNVTGASPAGCTSTIAANVFTSACLGLQDHHEDLEMNVFPNPFNDRIIFELKFENKGLSCEVYNYLGQLICRREVSSNNFEIDLPGQASGVYFIHLLDADQHRTVVRMMKE